MITVKITREIVHEASYEDACSVQHAVDMAHRSAQYCNKVTRELVEVTVIDAKATGSHANSVTDALQSLATLGKIGNQPVPDYLIDPATWHALPPKPDANTAQPLEDKPPVRGTAQAGILGTQANHLSALAAPHPKDPTATPGIGTIGGLANVYGSNSASNDPLYGEWSPGGLKYKPARGTTYVSTNSDPGEPAPI